jgi:hypothetical protein
MDGSENVICLWLYELKYTIFKIVLIFSVHSSKFRKDLRHRNMTAALSPDREIKGISKKLSSVFPLTNFLKVEQQLIQRLAREDLERQVNPSSELASSLEVTSANALRRAYTADDVDAAHLFLQRILYLINRLNLFRYEGLRHHTNERSSYLQWVRDRLKSVWQE